MEVFSATFALVLALVCGVLTAFTLKQRNGPRPLPPGPRGLQALCSTLQALANGTLNRKARVWAKEYGEIVLCRSVLGNICFLNSARLMREVFADKQREAITSDRPTSFAGWFAMYNYKDVVTPSSSDPEWTKKRKLFHHALKFYGDGVERFESTVRTELRHLTSEIEDMDGKEIQIENLLSYSILCVLSALMNGKMYERESEVIQAMTEVDAAITEMFSASTDILLSTFPFLRFVPGTYYKELCERQTRSKAAMFEELFIKTKKTHTPHKPRGIIDVLIDEQLKGENQWLTDEHIQALILNIVTGGYITSLQSLKALFLYLSYHPEVTQRIQKEIEDKIGDRPPGVEHRRDFPYTEAVVMETTRLSYVSNIGLPHEMREDIYVDGFCIPKGTAVFANIAGFHHDPAVWDEPDRFRPERFLDDVTGELLPVHHPVRQNFLPFGIGKRSCPGEVFARSRIFLYVTTLLQRFDVLPPVKHDHLPMSEDSWRDNAIMELKPFHLILRKRT